MKKYLYILCFTLLYVYGRDLNHIVTIEGFSQPQAITISTLSAFVSNIGNNTNVGKSGSGFISKLDKTGKIIDLKFIENLNIPRGIATLDNILYVVDMNILKGFNLQTKKQVLNLPISGTDTLSDVVVKDSNTLFVADRDTGLILLVDIKKKSYYTFATIDSNLGILQNIALDKKYLYVSTFDKQHSKGNLLRINLETKEVKLVYEFLEKIGGIALTENGGIIVASMDKSSKLYKISQNGTIYTVDMDADLQSPTKFWLDNQSIWIPDSLSNTVQKIIPEQ